ncbi:hypothetical protein HELRODRAFT_184124 [Helobdella robusta]|uniref:Uncharacterized protein n=1 Tax=Helobdella robusta TaxID=6412 RepID=T1FKM5_HELRO|nr:hypothetical protein HELRODRAFT_184124 [Helobdella robusta]ESO07463.1 hypothetical protein HELRODRAFT_184124 [Helobdella robusta]
MAKVNHPFSHSEHSISSSNNNVIFRYVISVVNSQQQIAYNNNKSAPDPNDINNHYNNSFNNNSIDDAADNNFNAAYGNTNIKMNDGKSANEHSHNNCVVNDSKKLAAPKSQTTNRYNPYSGTNRTSMVHGRGRTTKTQQNKFQRSFLKSSDLREEQGGELEEEEDCNSNLSAEFTSKLSSFLQID